LKPGDEIANPRHVGHDPETKDQKPYGRRYQSLKYYGFDGQNRSGGAGEFRSIGRRTLALSKVCCQFHHEGTLKYLSLAVQNILRAGTGKYSPF
jgi:hypothetical protein